MNIKMVIIILNFSCCDRRRFDTVAFSLYMGMAIPDVGNFLSKSTLVYMLYMYVETDDPRHALDVCFISMELRSRRIP